MDSRLGKEKIITEALKSSPAYLLVICLSDTKKGLKFAERAIKWLKREILHENTIY